ncbi:Site-specific recombinase XerD [Thermomonospora echinospora]|uniref:Site-specific recombinase XerD n=1 Tax=Thermomonospora echinospora TaxID=1992 RepID=A0A1H6EBX8_9ACTN|nr:tyrosine-type recombinase/integrase [Thermomonospora echinospora]SEG94285.1 Site-specific recombinase XerD [Thermomonospora echinospora]
MFLYKTSSAAALVGAGLGGVDAGRVLELAGARDGVPFILGPDGSYDLELNRFVREMDGWGVRSALTVEAYARDLALFCRFLALRRGGRSIWEAGQEDLRAYKRVRRRAEGSFRVAASTWNRFLAALDKWVEWAIYEGLLEGEPFRKVERTVVTPRGLAVVRVNAEYEQDEESGPARFLSYEDYLTWRDVGLLGRLPDGRADRCWRGRNGQRNAVFADLLVVTGMRLSEASYLLVNELPSLVERQKVGALALAATVTKRGRARMVYVSRRVLRALHAYVGIEREELVHRRAAAGAYRVPAQWLGVVGAGRTSVTLTGGRGRLACARLAVEDRVRLARVDAAGTVGEPLLLWLGEDGLPLGRSTWQAVFRRANDRCASVGLDLEVSPHTLRHTFAVHMLGLLLRQTVRALRMEDARTLSGQQVKRMLIGDPMRRLQLLLGHRSQETIYVYLDMLDEAQEIVLAALADWDEQAEALARVKASVA